METSFLVIFAFLFFQTSVLSIITTSSNVTCIERERQSLLQLKQGLIDKYNLLSTWSGIECCEWRGVGCDTRNGHVVKLNLQAPVPLKPYLAYEKPLAGELSPSLQSLKHLRYLDLSRNGFTGNFPEFLGTFNHLEYLNLSRSGFIGDVPRSLGNLSRLQSLDLSGCPLLTDLGCLSSLLSLRHLDISSMIWGGEKLDWFNSIVMLPSLLTLNLGYSDIDISSIKFVNFTSLISLDLSVDYIHSTIPVWFSNLTGLVHLNLEDNAFHGKIPDFFGTFSDLAYMDLSDNSIDMITDVLCNLSSLVHMDFNFNRLSGPIPACLGLLSRLEDLYLQYNGLTGNIPMSLGQLSKLKNLDLSGNSLVGVLSETHFTNLMNLNSLKLSENSLALNFSFQWIPPFQLNEFFARSCNIGPHFPNWLQTQTNIQRLDLYNTSIRDTMPEWFENILSRIRYLDMSNNEISGKLPRFHFNSSNEMPFDEGTLKLKSNKFEGSLATFPSNVRFLDLSDNFLSGHVPPTDETMNPNLKVVILSKNRFTGSIPVHLCKVPSIGVLDLSRNKFSGWLLGCLGKLRDLEVIDLGNNTITGVVPSSLGSLQFLKSLHLQNNRFEGEIPLSLQNLTSLVTMDLGNNMFVGTIPFSKGENLTSLRFLNLQSNKFTGKIPLQLCQLNALQYLSLAHNDIIGTIPRCFRNLSGMIRRQVNLGYTLEIFDYQENVFASTKGIQLVYTKTLEFLTSIDLSSNNITGEIPDALMNLVGLNNLNLSRNQLKGHVPMKIGNLSQLESLDLSMNMLSGRIPQSLTNLYSLSYLNLSFNKLSGEIPVGNQLQTLDDPSIYKGNNGLCGPPVSRSCKGNDASYNYVGENEGQDDTEGWWFYAGMGPGFVVGIIGLLGSLHFIRSWRVAYFRLSNMFTVG